MNARKNEQDYLLQSIIGSFIFSGYGLCLYNKVGKAYAVLIGFAMVVALYAFCRYWFRTGQNGNTNRRGPLEGLWRKLTWIV